MIVLDTSVLSLALRRSAKAPRVEAAERLAELIRANAPLGIPGVVLQELLSGVKSNVALAQLEEEVRGVPLLLATRATHLEAARVCTACARRGVAASAFDSLIAAHAITADAPLFTVDDDFVRIAAHTKLRLLES